MSVPRGRTEVVGWLSRAHPKSETAPAVVVWLDSYTDDLDNSARGNGAAHA
ncbi:hypothetical protein [Nocardia abscessus]|uniref:hypothetical protein n=1 Tax=Nocardia abscessus TaxID=120957 RepID=UPI0024556FF9|nr:hypothetical protein [Nocardia abscessus]